MSASDGSGSSRLCGSAKGVGKGYNEKQVNAVTPQNNITTMQDILDALDGNPDLQREFHKHLVEVIRKDDDLREELRKEILTQELLQLPARFTRLEEDVAEIKGVVRRMSGQISNLEGGQTRMSGQISNLEGGQTRMSGQISNLEGGQTRMSGQISNLMGHDYEARAIERSRRMVRRYLGMERAIVLHASEQSSAPEFENEILVPAIRAGRISRQQADELEDADCIIRCEDEQGNVVCGVVEISVTVQDHDRSRAVERAEIFSAATGLRTLPFVVGQEEEEPGADAPDVPFLEYPQ